MTIIEQLYEDARAGIPGIGPSDAVPRPGIDATPAERDEAARRLVERYTFLCGATGFLCGLPGYLSLPFTLPINVAGVLVLQLHLGPTLALLYGHDPADPEVRRRCIARVTGGWRREDDELLHRAVDKVGERSVRFVSSRSSSSAAAAGASRCSGGSWGQYATRARRQTSAPRCGRYSAPRGNGVYSTRLVALSSAWTCR